MRNFFWLVLLFFFHIIKSLGQLPILTSFRTAFVHIVIGVLGCLRLSVFVYFFVGPQTSKNTHKKQTKSFFIRRAEIKWKREKFLPKKLLLFALSHLVNRWTFSTQCTKYTIHMLTHDRGYWHFGSCYKQVSRAINLVNANKGICLKMNKKKRLILIPPFFCRCAKLFPNRNIAICFGSSLASTVHMWCMCIYITSGLSP